MIGNRKSALLCRIFGHKWTTIDSFSLDHSEDFQICFRARSLLRLCLATRITDARPSKEQRS